jgi:hypothetical protein
VVEDRAEGHALCGKDAGMTRLYRVWAKFEPDFVNPMTARRGQWRVTLSGDPASFEAGVILCFGNERGFISTKSYPVGSIIRPHAELRRVLAARKGMQ